MRLILSALTILHFHFLAAQNSNIMIGNEGGTHTILSYNTIETKNATFPGTLVLNPTIGDVIIGNGGGAIKYSYTNQATGIGTLLPQSRLHITGSTDASLSSNGLLMIGSATTSGVNMIFDANEIMTRSNGAASPLFINRDGGNVEFFGFGSGSFIVHGLPYGDHGNMQYNSSTGQFFYDNSSRRYKENISTLQDDWTRILKTRPVTYTRPGNTGRWEFGYIAEEIDSIGLTNMIGYDAQGFPEDVRYDKMIIYLVEMIKIQQAQIEALEQENDCQENIETHESLIQLQENEINQVKAELALLKHSIQKGIPD